MGLTRKAQRFIEEYCIDWNATQAALRAGYSKKGTRQTAFKLLANADIASAIERKKNEAAARSDVKIEEILRELKSLAFDDPDIRKSDKLKALELLGRYRSMFNDKITMDGEQVKVVFNVPRPAQDELDSSKQRPGLSVIA